MNVIILSPRDPVPVYTGLLERIYQMCRYIGRNHRVRVCFPAPTSHGYPEEGRFPEEQPFERVGFENLALNTLEQRIPHYSWLRGIYQTHPWLYRSLRRQITRFDPDVMVVEMPFLMPLALSASHGYDIPLVLTEHNIQFKITQRLNIPGTSPLRSFEAFVGNQADHVLTVSEADRKTLEEYVSTPISVSPNGVDIERYSPKDHHAVAGLLEQDGFNRPLFIYHGSLGNAQNNEAVETLVSRIFPALRSVFPEAHLMLIGSNPPNIEREGVITTGLVDDLPKYICAADVALVPLLSGSGTKLKILEYMVSGIPVVTTSIGAEGLPIKDGIHAIIEDNWEEFIDRTIDLVEDDDYYDSIVSSGRLLVEEKFSWDQTLRPYDQILTEIAKETPGSANDRIR